ncbi:ankyrin repeat domain-containing protein 31 isoform X2 [Rattus norvegicus]|uniref:ankyrin repeat domain-containing protein 31 isoform X2 n=1 Tax=Rattus norvegicus TaxID=10116 RepID=UPI001917330F|nr:ankyrin repeat domain-containing protein 31 isoform X2 [Rattus norvegicus]
MEKGDQASDCDSDETVIEGSVTENELEDDELPWRRFLSQDTTFTSEFCFHSGINGTQNGMHSPEIQLGLKLRKDSQEQNDKNEVLRALSEDLVLQDPQDETTQNQVLLQTRKELPVFSVSVPHPEVSWSHQTTGGPGAEICEHLPHSEKELSENSDSPEVSLLSGTSLMASDLVTLKEQLTEPVKTLAVPNTFSEPGKKVTLTLTSIETKDEESSLETFVSALEKLLESPEYTQEERLLEIMNDFSPQEFLTSLSNSMSSVSVPSSALSAGDRDELGNKAGAVLPAQLLAAINTLPGADVGPICQGQERSSSVSGGNGCLEVQPAMSQKDEDCTHIAQNIEDPKPFRLQTLTHENATSYEQLNKKENSDSMKNTSTQKTPRVLRRSSRLEKLRASRDVHTDVILERPERILSEALSCKDRINSIFTTENFSKRKNMHSSRFKNEQIRKNEQLRIKNEVNTAGINKRNAKGESRLHVASKGGNLSLVKMLIESGADVNLKDNAGWTPLHKASSGGFDDIIIELLKAGANVNCENVDGILPLHGASAGNHLKAAEILLEHGANPSQKDQKQRTALDEADDEKMKELLKSHGAIETAHGEERSSIVPVKIPAIRPKRYKPFICDNDKAVGSPAPSHKAKRSESRPVHQTISAILKDLEEKQETLLKFEIRNSEDEEQYIEKMLDIKEVMDNILAQQKTERDDLAKKYRVSMESFKHGALREQLANLATRQKSLLVVAKKQKKIRLKIQNYKTATPSSGNNLRKLPCNSDISSDKTSQDPPGVGNSALAQSGSLSPNNLAYRSMQEMPFSPEIQSDSQNTNICLNAEAIRGEEFPGSDTNSKQNVQDCASGGLLKSTSDDTEKMTSSSQPVALTSQAEYSQAENFFPETSVKGYGFDAPSLTGTINISEDKSIFSQNDVCLPAFPQNQGLSRCKPKRRNKRTGSQQPSEGASKPLAQTVAILDTYTARQTKPCLKKSASVALNADSMQISPPSVSAHQPSSKKAPHHSTTPRKKTVQLKDLILLGRINPGNNILEFKTQETTHRASVLLSGKLKVENGQIYQNPVTWLKDVLGGGSYVTWNYAWNKVTYLGKELLKYVSEAPPVSAEPSSTPQQHQPCLSGTSRESMQIIPHYLQIKEILLISDQELLPCHVMEQHWKFYVECKKLSF